MAHRTDVDAHAEVFEADNGTAYEGLSTDVEAGDTAFMFDVDPRFAAAATGRTVVKVTFLDRGTGAFAVDTGAGGSAAVERGGSDQWCTATIAVPDGALSGTAPQLRISLADDADELVVRFVRLVRVTG